MGSSHTLDQLDICFDDTHAVANTGLLLAATLAERLGIEQAADALIDLGERAGAHRPGRKLLTLVHSMLAGGDCSDDADLLRCGATSQVLGHRVMAPSTLGTFLRSFTFGHVRQLDRLTEQLLTRAWAAGAGPGDAAMTMDLDSTVCEVHGDHKQGAAYGYTRTLGYHPLLATRADTGEVLHARQRTGRANTARGAARFVDELAARVRRAGATGELTMRADSGFFFLAKTIRACRRHQLHYSITISQTKPIRQAIAAIDEAAWTDIVYPDGGLVQVAETRYKGDRLIVRRTPPGRRPGRAVPQLALPRLGHRPGRHDRRAGPRSQSLILLGSGFSIFGGAPHRVRVSVGRRPEGGLARCAASDQGRRPARTSNSLPSGSARQTQLSSPVWPTSACRAPRSSRRRTSSSCSLSVGLRSRWSRFLTVLPSGTCANVNVGGTGPRRFLPSGTIGEPIVTIPSSSSCTS
jgi:hypothetical protein